MLGLWRERGILGIEGNHLFQLGSWGSVLIGQRFLPKGVHALADRADPAYAARQVREVVRESREGGCGAPADAR